MKGTRSISLLVGLASMAFAQGTSAQPTPTAIRDADQPMPAAKMAKVQKFSLPSRYQDRTKYPLPAVHSNAKNPYFNPYDPAVPNLWREQGMSCGNAQAVGCLFNHEANRARNFSTPAGAKDPAFSYQYTYHFLNDGNMLSGDAWMMVEAMDILKETGAASTEDFGGLEWGNGFLGWMSGYDKYHRAMRYRVDEYYQIDASAAGAEEAIKQVLVDNADGSPHGGNLVLQVSFSNRITKTTIQGRSVYENFASGGGHALSIVGYDDTFLPERGGCWLLHDVHANGLSYSPRDRFKASGPLNWPGIGIPALFLRVKQNYTPRLTFKITLSHNQRGNISVMAGVGSPTSTGPSVWKDYAGAFNYSGGAFPMGGRGQSNALEFGLDLTDFAAQLASPNQKLYLMVFSKGGAGAIDKVSLMDYTGAAPRELAGEAGKPIAPGNANAPVMTQVAITFPGTLPPVSIRENPGRGMDPAWRRGGSVRVRLTPEGAASATLNVRDSRGKSVYAGRFDRAGLAGMANGPYLDLPWAGMDTRGGRVAPGLYFATVELLHADARTRSASTRIRISP